MKAATPAVKSGDAALAFRALADTSRVEILRILAGGERCVCELAATLGLSQPLLSHHLRTLREVGLVRVRKEGRWMHYALAREGVAECHGVLDAVLEHHDASTRLGRPGCC
ncbi:MAG TPA: metalloregulator ArsR/SmtB family transcription factor [Gemmatimonadales bacterium]